MKIPSLALLDFWSNYRERFDDLTGALRHLPDCIAVMDGYARDQMIASGFDAARLVITGQPALDGLQVKRTQFSVARRQHVRDAWGVGVSERVALFASQPLTTMPGAAGLDEKKIVVYLLRALESIAVQEHLALTLLLRPHPREESEWMQAMQSDTIRVLVSTDGDAHEVSLAADVVTGINSMLLVEACYLGCVVVSIQIGLYGQDMLPTNAAGYSRAIYEERALIPALNALLSDVGARTEMQARVRNLQVKPATPRVVELCYRMLGMTG